MSHDPVLSRPTPDRCWPGWDAKSSENLRKKPLYRRGWFLRAVVTGTLTAVFFGLIGSVLLVRRQQERALDFNRQQQGLGRFLESRDFASFSRSTDIQSLALINFIAAHPVDSRKRLPAVLAWEDAHNAKPWTDAIAPVADADPVELSMIAGASRHLLQTLGAHGFTLDEKQHQAGRRQMLRLLAPYMESFTGAAPEASFSKIWSNPELQGKLLQAMSARTGLSVDELDTLFYLQSTLGPGAAL